MRESFAAIRHVEEAVPAADWTPGRRLLQDRLDTIGA
jgi:hypothetical protein